MTFDNEYELFKIKKYFPSAELLLRIRADDSKSLCQVSVNLILSRVTLCFHREV